VWRRFRLPRFGAVDGAFEGAGTLFSAASAAAAAILPSKNSRSRKRVVTQVLPTFPAGT